MVTDGANSKSSFADQVPGLAARHARRTNILQRRLCAIALALGGRPDDKASGGHG